MNETGPEPPSLSERLNRQIKTETQQIEIVTQTERERLVCVLRRSSRDALNGFEDGIETRLLRLKSLVTTARIEMERDLKALKTRPNRVILIAATVGAISASLTWATLPILAAKIAEALQLIGS